MIAKKKSVLLILLVFILLALLWFACFHFLDFGTVKRITARAMIFSVSHLWITAAVIVFIHAISMLLSLPTKAIFSIVAGATLGVLPGIAATLLGVLIGTSGLFFTTRHVGATREGRNTSLKIANLKMRIAAHPIIAVAALRLVVILPYGPVTMACALSPITYRQFLIGSIAGDLPVIALYALAGEKLMHLANQGEAMPLSTAFILAAAGILMLAAVLLKTKPIQN